MQNMHPQLGAAVRMLDLSSPSGSRGCSRSLYPIGGVVFDRERAPATGAEVRDYHIPIRGRRAGPALYSALNPDVFYWARPPSSWARS